MVVVASFRVTLGNLVAFLTNLFLSLSLAFDGFPALTHSCAIFFPLEPLRMFKG